MTTQGKVFLDGGKPAATPVTVIQSATSQAQAQLIITLGELPNALAASALGSPSIIIVVGDVVRCAPTDAYDTALLHHQAST